MRNYTWNCPSTLLVLCRDSRYQIMGALFLLHLSPAGGESIFLTVYVSWQKRLKTSFMPTRTLPGANLFIHSDGSGKVVVRQKSLLACIRKSRFSRLMWWFITSCGGQGGPSPCWRHIYCAESRSRHSNTRETWTSSSWLTEGLEIVNTRELEMFSLERRTLQKHLMRGSKEVKDSSDRWQNKSQERQTEIYEIAFQLKNTFTTRVVKDWMWCLEMLWSLCRLKPNRAGPWATCSVLPCSGKRGLDCIICRWPFPATIILWFWDSAVSSTLWCLPLQSDFQKYFSEGWQVWGGSKGKIWNLQIQMLSNAGLDSRAKHKSKYADLCQHVKSEP